MANGEPGEEEREGVRPQPKGGRIQVNSGASWLIYAVARQWKAWLHEVMSCLSLAASIQKPDGHFLVMLQRGFLHGWGWGVGGGGVRRLWFWGLFSV